MTLAPNTFLERRLFLFSLPGIATLIALALIVAVAAVSGHSAVERVASAQDEFAQGYEEGLAEWREGMVEIETTGEAASPYDARPMNLRFPAVLPPAPLGDFATGKSQLMPSSTVITGWSNPADLFNEYEFDNPTSLSLGSFDLTFVVVLLMPLLMIAISFDVIASDRERGQLRMIAIQAGHVAPTAWQRLAIRNGALWLAFSVLAAIAAFLAPGGVETSGRFSHFLFWLGIALIYGLFWFAAIALASTLLKRGETIASALFAAWAVFVFAIPAVGGAIAEAIYPPPSRLAYLSEMREGEVIAVRETAELTAGFLADHPEMTVSDEGVPGFYSSNFLANQQARERTAPVLDAFEESRERRISIVGLLQYLSPAMLADRALARIAGGDIGRSLDFQRQARIALADLAERIGPAVVARQRVSIADYDAIPKFEFEDKSLSSKMSAVAIPLGFLFLVTIALLIWAKRRMSAPLDRLL